jgi:hypothetical protein
MSMRVLNESALDLEGVTPMHIKNRLKRSLVLLPAVVVGSVVLIAATGASAAPPKGPPSLQPNDVLPTFVCAPTAPHARPMGIACKLSGGGALPKGAHTLLLQLPRKYTAIQLLCHKNARQGIACTIKHATTVTATGTHTVKVALPAKWLTVTISCQTTSPRLGIACRASK